VCRSAANCNGFRFAQIIFDMAVFVRTNGRMRARTIDVRVSPDEKETIRAAAEREGLSLSAWARMLLLRAAKAGIKMSGHDEMAWRTALKKKGADWAVRELQTKHGPTRR
jgi:hypothetical protein